MARLVDLCDQLSGELAPVHVPRVLTVAGSDSSGGAGIEADVKTITAHKCYAVTCITALTAQNSLGVHNVTTTPAETVEKVLVAIADDQIALDAIKLGMLPDETLSVITPFLAARAARTPIVLDPVFVAKNGDRLSSVGALKKAVELFQHAALITPNSREVEVLLAVLRSSDPSVEEITITTADDFYTAARLLGSRFKVDVLFKGGLVPVNENLAVDPENPVYILNVLYEHRSEKLTVFRSNHIDSPNLHGTGCTLSSAVACYLARGASLATAVENAIGFVNEAIRHAEVKPNGPLNHTWAIKRPHEVRKDAGLLSFLMNHEKVVPHWQKYTHHQFVRQAMEDTLPVEKFNYFLKQDYRYLQAYHRVHVNLRSITESEELQEYVDEILSNIETEMERHKTKLKSRWPDLDLEEIDAGRATLNYINYLVELYEKTHDWLLCKTALMPCLIGYNHAAANALNNGTKFLVADPENNAKALMVARKLQEEAENGKLSYQVDAGSATQKIYRDWLSDYVAPWYLDACKRGEQVLNEYFDEYVSRKQHEEGFDKGELLDTLADIFAKVSSLEASFWDDCINYPENIN
ncbi:hypothetical protein KL918_004945 [Ogataea parapolymorpha]|uniref:Phosphomethylpyrimidine kinase 2 n=1 Tax=Ogataea parapolymorpha (strain ATCC 26012 / BCRC 20466 / JCM 22074 / NRRL Y-7560 / DL-1) TaxID=871575 RepID=W1QGA2_OGAPD|nr:putative phosphomethylpyrimidine kinase 2 [Ogataea parapolymorpha DL-1]ESX00156.1 putative phosphomethylpyrimidine kinase 2 [Ogataea parapolymorpha DL-1]KAG7865069.1 hypothetical protein KL918_004945 [Ogataea parapolymorpha]KAG7872245.1 hypothetical protein KL916_003268 [Ogataea parapolymorpha]